MCLFIGERTSVINKARAITQTARLSLCEIIRFETSDFVGIMLIAPNTSPKTSTIVATPHAESKPSFRFKPNAINDNVAITIGVINERIIKNLSKILLPLAVKSTSDFEVSAKIANKGRSRANKL